MSWFSSLVARTNSRSNATRDLGSEAPIVKVRCPYCIDREQFRIMIAQEPGERFACEGCGHVAVPENLSFACVCEKCRAVYSMDNIQRRAARAPSL